MRRMLDREMRMVDMQVMAALQNGTAFFASTSLFAIGGALTIIRSTDDVLNVVATLPIGIQTGRVLWEMKAIGLAVIFVYAFFKFGWSYRLYNYVAILLGAMPPPAEKDTAEAQAHVKRTTGLFTAAGRHFNHGQRAFFFALGYLGWFVSPYVFMGTTAAVVFVMWWRQFGSDASTRGGRLIKKRVERPHRHGARLALAEQAHAHQMRHRKPDHGGGERFGVAVAVWRRART